MKYRPPQTSDEMECECGWQCLRDDIPTVKVQAERTNCPNELAQEAVWEYQCPQCDAWESFDRVDDESPWQRFTFHGIEE